MRNADEIKALIIGFARSDNRVRAVLLNGSRANPNFEPDELQDFDIVFIVESLESFTANHTWTDFFGKKVVSQMPEEMNLGGNYSQEKTVSFSYLMQFEDGSRIDLTLFPKNKLDTDFLPDSLTVLWLDKDNLFPNIPPSSDKDYHINKPIQKEFSDVCNEFWWVSTYIAKGLLRNEITYAKEILETIVRPMFMRMIEWKIGSENDFSVNIGIGGKFIKNYLSEHFYQDILQTYSTADVEENWKSFFKMTEIFQQTSIETAKKLNLQCNKPEQEKTLVYLRQQYEKQKNGAISDL
jgi:aminoglycoside 6-adenylyltransferase